MPIAWAISRRYRLVDEVRFGQVEQVDGRRTGVRAAGNRRRLYATLARWPA
jgi:hypothetical protein